MWNVLDLSSSLNTPINIGWHVTEERLWTPPRRGPLAKLGLCKLFCSFQTQCGKLKSPVSLCSGMSQLAREEAEWSFFSFTTWRFLKCHNHYSPTLSFSPFRFKLWFQLSHFSLYFPPPPVFSIFSSLPIVKYTAFSPRRSDMRDLYYISGKTDFTGWQAEGKHQSQKHPKKKKGTSRVINQRKSGEFNLKQELCVSHVLNFRLYSWHTALALMPCTIAYLQRCSNYFTHISLHVHTCFLYTYIFESVRGFIKQAQHRVMALTVVVSHEAHFKRAMILP